jgi:two-component system sensor histidine kinase EvgS
MDERSNVPPGVATCGSTARLLVTGGNAINRNAVVCMLHHLGLRADVAVDSSEAVKALRLQPYDLVLLDCGIAWMEGLAAAGEIRKLPQCTTPIVAMTAETSAYYIDRCLANGIDDLLRKPVRFTELAETLHRWLPADRGIHLQVDCIAGD